MQKQTPKPTWATAMVRVTAETKTRLKVAAAKRNLSMGELIHQMLDQLEGEA